jgi:hypothetical protein
MKRYIVCVPQKWDERIVAIPYTNLKTNCIGEISVMESKAGRLDNWNHFYSLKQVCP